jgi:hypothetical protein
MQLTEQSFLYDDAAQPLTEQEVEPLPPEVQPPAAPSPLQSFWNGWRVQPSELRLLTMRRERLLPDGIVSM